ncbi:acid-activated urea channel, partial [Moraxella catarrhalis]|nr:acid-activated urea channel [Moraxella catarrhalis]
MLGIVLLYVWIVLISNGICGLTKVDSKSTAVRNFYVGGLSIICNIVVITYSALRPTAPVE